MIDEGRRKAKAKGLTIHLNRPPSPLSSLGNPPFGIGDWPLIDAEAGEICHSYRIEGSRME